MNLLRLHCPLEDSPDQCQWALLDDDGRLVSEGGALSTVPRRAKRIQLIVPASQVFITRTRLPAAARHGSGSVLAFAIEERTVSEPDANQVSWLGTVEEDDVLAVVNRQSLERWRNALEKAGIRSYEIQSEMLLVPWVTGNWSVAWNGREGFVRTGKLEAAVTDTGDHASPPLSLRLMLDEARERGGQPASIALYTTAADATPDIEAWQNSLGVAIRPVGTWDWRSGTSDEGVSLAQQRPRWGGISIAASKLRGAAWIAGIALAIHAIALVIDWTLLAREQQGIRRQMESRFRATFPDTVAVVDPALQMRRKLAETRRAAGQPDAGDFLPIIEKVSAEIMDIPAGSVRIVSYESGRLTLEVAAMDEATVSRIVTRLRQSGMSVDASSSSAGTARAGVVITVRTS
jgi:general secretion pathway protein L